MATFSPPQSYGRAFSASGVAVIPKSADKKGPHSGPIVVVPDFECHRILFFENSN